VDDIKSMSVHLTLASYTETNTIHLKGCLGA